MLRVVQKNILAGLFVIAAGLLVGLGCGGDESNPASSSGNPGTTPPPTTAPTASVVISNFAFSPSSLTVKVGTTVTWRNNDNTGHTVTSDSGDELESALLSQGDTYSHTFNSVGVFPYHCTPHPVMTATVTVEQ